MYNPLAEISQPLMKAMLASPKLFVREYYPRGLGPLDGTDTIPLLFTYYEKENSIEVNRAKIHLAQAAADPYRFLYDSDIAAHHARLIKAGTPSAKYKIFINLLYNNWEPPHWLRKKIHAYMLLHFDWWNYNKTYRLHIHLKDRYGKLYLHLSWKANRAELALEEIENFIPCATT